MLYQGTIHSLCVYIKGIGGKLIWKRYCVVVVFFYVFFYHCHFFFLIVAFGKGERNTWSRGGKNETGK